ncbi:hypothetical protein VSR01_16415 [Actinacidiphila sp. DG2A-62]|uniref:hypothetical protein n=1 Tax=Actinacidiphila sp. DG2A-62 TaxID=3108821 RepID=UPI002DBD3BE8|nr:hypothetical protein [Actinacidiphila sp. DG2A-62]MEC3995030.1 hypothetical protein [Actinacidiphila sp. DG2A-62]
MSDAFDYMMKTGLYKEIVHTLAWAQTQSSSDDIEIFLNPDDAAHLTEDVEDISGFTVLGRPLHRSVGVPLGKCMLFDRTRGKYIRRDEPIAD